MDPEELLRRYAAGERDFSGVNFGRSVKLINTNLRGIILLGAKMHSAELEGADLEGANLSRATLDNVSMSGVNLAEAILERTSLCEVDLSSAVSSGMLFDMTEFSFPALPDPCIPDLSILTGMTFSDKPFNTNLRNASLSAVTLYGADLTGDGRYLTFCNTIMPDDTIKTEYIE